MSKNKKIKLSMFFIIGVLLLAAPLISGVYTRTNFGASYSRGMGLESGGYWKPDRSMCKAGQDFIIQITPFGCTPAVVRADLLEEQNVPVFCQLGATKINPLIDVEAIESISFSGKYPKEVSGIGFHPARAALGVKGDLNSPVLNNIGYAVIVLKKQENASAMPDYVQGNLTAKIKYDIKNAFGIGKADFYLPEISDKEWEDKKIQYSFWKGRFYLRAQGIDESGARISVYDDTRKLASVDLERGKTSRMIYLPGFDCLAGLKLKLDELKAPDTRAKLDINGEIVEVAEKENFLENRCWIKKIDKKGLVQEVEVYCKGDEERETFPLRISPRVNLTICDKDGNNCITKDYEVGDILYKDKEVKEGSRRNVFLGYIGEKKDGRVFIISAITQHHTSEDFLNSIDMELIEKFAKIEENLLKDKTFLDGLKMEFAVYGAIMNAIVRGSDFSGPIILGSEEVIKFPVGELMRPFIKAKKFWTLEKDWSAPTYTKKLIKFNGFAGPQDKELGEGERINCVSSDWKFDASKCKVGDAVYLFLNVFDATGKGWFVKIEDDKWTLKKEKSDSLSAVAILPLVAASGNKEKFATNEEINRVVFNQWSSVLGLTINGETYTPDEFIDKLEEDRKKRYSESEYYQNAIKDYDEIISKYSSEKFQDGFSEISFGEEALYQKILLAEKAKQLKTMSELCKEFERKYPNSKKNLKKQCEDELKLSSSKADSKDVLINGMIKRISLESIYEPKFDDYGAVIRITGTEDRKFDGTFELEKNDRILLSSEEWFELKEVNEDYISIYANVKHGGIKEGIIGIKQENYKIKLNDCQNLGENNQYEVRLKGINLKKQAKVSVIPNIDNAGTEANFSFRIGIEQRAIKLSPEKIREKIESLNQKITDWEERSEQLGNVVKGLKTACLGVGTYLIVKNFFANTGGKAIARQEVMKEIWYPRCSDDSFLKEKNYKTPNECLTREANNIDRDVDAYYKILESKNKEFEDLQKDITTTTWMGERIVDDEKLAKKVFASDRKKELIEILKENGIKEIEINNEKKSVSEIVDMINENTFSITAFRDLEVMAKSAGVDSLKEMAEKQIKTELTNIYKTNQERVEREKQEEAMKEDANLEGVSYSVVKGEKSIEIPYGGGKVKNGQTYGRIVGGSLIQKVNYKGKNYMVQISDKASDNIRGVEKVFSGDGTIEIDITQDPIAKEIKENFIFKTYDSSTYKNPYKSSLGESTPCLRYYETEPYKGLPAIVPFDLKNGWYAWVGQTLPIFGSIKSYDKSGRVTSYWVCNVGENGIEENKGGDDICEMINTGTGQPYNVFPGLDEGEALRVVRDANKAVEQASRVKSRASGKTVRISTSKGSFDVKICKPAVDIPEMQCQNFMSPKDCQLLFNVCDPVVCPSSRCNYGGTYYVKDVIQSGIIGSIVLCLPNIREGIYIPVCLTGIKAGIDGLLSVYKSYRDCLQESLDTGKMVGICDEVYSIHLCELFWRESLPLTKMIVPKTIEWILGQNVRGGGEYLGVASAWDNAGKSMDYFVQYYAASSYEAFKARVAEGVGDAICRNSISMSYPEGGNILDTLTEPDSPPQFHGWFHEIKFTTVTSPPLSHYKVYYHIYAGKESRAYYKVYLKSPSGTSFYQDNPIRYIASGYIPTGGYASETKDFTAPSGYNQLCIMVNGQEECGFKQVSTSYALNYVNDKYMEEQTSKKKIMSEKECISGSVSAYSLLTPSLEGAAEEMVAPAIYKRGIIRICATDNPGKSTNPSRWVEVGNCGSENIKCWLDRESVKNVIKHVDIEDKVLEEHTKTQLERLRSEGKYFEEGEFRNLVNEVEGLIKDSNFKEAIAKIDEKFEKAFFNKEKAKLLYLRAKAYGGLATKKIKIKGDNKKDTGNKDSVVENPAHNNVDSEKNKNRNELPLAELDPSPKDGNLLERLELYKKIIGKMSNKYNVSAKMIKAIISQESDAISSSNDRCTTDDINSYGLMQVSRSAAKDVRMLKQFDKMLNEKDCSPSVNIEIGTAYYKLLYDKYDDKKLALAAYNWGQGNIDRVCSDKKWENCREIPNAVLQYVSNVLGYKEAF